MIGAMFLGDIDSLLKELSVGCTRGGEIESFCLNLSRLYSPLKAGNVIKSAPVYGNAVEVSLLPILGLNYDSILSSVSIWCNLKPAD